MNPIHIEMTPYPHIEKFYLTEPLTNEIVRVQTQEDAVKNPLFEKLFAIPGITSFLVEENCLTVTRSPQADWLFLEEEIINLLEKNVKTPVLIKPDLKKHQIVIPPQTPQRSAIVIESTPNPQAKKFTLPVSWIQYGPYEFQTATEKSPLSIELFLLEKVERLLIASSSLTVTALSESDWPALEIPIKTILQKYLETEKPLLEEERSQEEPLFLTEGSIEERIVSLLNKEIRPRVAMDGGDILYKGYHQGQVRLQLRGACKGCPSSTQTLKKGIEVRLKQLIPEIQEVLQET